MVTGAGGVAVMYPCGVLVLRGGEGGTGNKNRSIHVEYDHSVDLKRRMLGSTTRMRKDDALGYVWRVSSAIRRLRVRMKNDFRA